MILIQANALYFILNIQANTSYFTNIIKGIALWKKDTCFGISLMTRS
jgi:hypothetical protein